MGCLAKGVVSRTQIRIYSGVELMRIKLFLAHYLTVFCALHRIPRVRLSDIYLFFSVFENDKYNF